MASIIHVSRISLYANLSLTPLSWNQLLPTLASSRYIPSNRIMQLKSPFNSFFLEAHRYPHSKEGRSYLPGPVLVSRNKGWLYVSTTSIATLWLIYNFRAYLLIDVHAFLAWFDISFECTHKKVKFSTGPHAQYTHWKYVSRWPSCPHQKDNI